MPHVGWCQESEVGGNDGRKQASEVQACFVKAIFRPGEERGTRKEQADGVMLTQGGRWSCVNSWPCLFSIKKMSFKIQELDIWKSCA
jgi:hypothetical protein